MTTEWTRERVDEYHARMQMLRQWRDDPLACLNDDHYGNPDPAADPGPYHDEPPSADLDRYDPDDWEQHRGPYWNEAHRDWD